jgi:polysaccharide export outer membrane protein
MYIIFKKNHTGLISIILAGLIPIFSFSSCGTFKAPPLPQLEYFQGRNLRYPTSIETVEAKISTINQGDILGIIVSSLNKESNEIMNFNNISSLPLTTFSPGVPGASSQPLGYPVDSLGNIALPIVGKIKVGGLTLQKAEEIIRIELDKTLKGSAVNIRFMNHKFTVLGEVGQVGIFNLLNDHTTIIEALTAAGDLSIYGKRDSITVIRVDKGKREIGKVNLRNRNVFTSPYFYIRNDDIIYVEPTKDKIIPKPPSIFVQRAPIYLSILTTTLTLFYLVSRL